MTASVQSAVQLVVVENLGRAVPDYRSSDNQAVDRHHDGKNRRQTVAPSNAVDNADASAAGILHSADFRNEKFLNLTEVERVQAAHGFVSPRAIAGNQSTISYPADTSVITADQPRELHSSVAEKCVRSRFGTADVRSASRVMA